MDPKFGRTRCRKKSHLKRSYAPRSPPQGGPMQNRIKPKGAHGFIQISRIWGPSPDPSTLSYDQGPIGPPWSASAIPPLCLLHPELTLATLRTEDSGVFVGTESGPATPRTDLPAKTIQIKMLGFHNSHEKLREKLPKRENLCFAS